MKKIEEYVRTIPDFPEPGIMFRDVTSVLQDPDGLKLAIDSMIKLLDGVDFDIIAGAESRGFIFGMPIAYALGKAFIPVQKKKNFLVRQSQQNMILNMEKQRSRFIKMQSNRDRRLY